MSEKVITPEAVLSYPYLFETQDPMEEGGEAKYGAVFVFLEGADLTALKKSVIEAAKEKWGDKAVGMLRDKKIRSPFRDDAEDKGYPEGSVFITARSKARPGVVSIYPDPNNGGKPTPITDPELIYPGCFVKASVRAFAYDVKGNKGVSFNLNNVQKLRDGERLDGRTKAEDEFDADQDAVGSLEDLTDEGTEQVDVAPPKARRGRKPAAAAVGAGSDDEDDISDLL